MSQGFAVNSLGSGNPGGSDTQIQYNDAGVFGGITGATTDGTTVTLTTPKAINTTDSASVQVARFDGDRATPADNDSAYQSYYLSNDAGTQVEFARMTWIATDVNAGTSEDGAIQWGVATAGVMTDHVFLGNAAFRPTTNDTHTLGSAAASWSDLFLASGGVINWDNGNITLTQSANTLTFGGAATSTLALGANNITMTGSIGTTGARLTKGWFTDLEVTNAIVGSATNVSTADESADTTCFPVFVTASGTQTLPLKSNTGLTYNSSTNNLGATTFTGALSGNATTATSAATLTTPRTIGGVSFDGSANIVPQTIQSVNEASDTTCFPLFITESGSQSLQPCNNTSFTFDSNTATLGATNLRLGTGGAIQTAQSAGNTLLIRAYDVDGAAYTTFATLTANNTPTMDLSTSVTVGSNKVVGSISSSVTDNTIVRMDSTTGSVVQSTGVVIDDSNGLYNYRAVFNNQTGTTYTTDDTDTGKILTFSNASAIAVTLHATATVGTAFTWEQKGAGQVTFASTGSGTVVNRQSHTKSAGQYACGTLFVHANSGGSAAVWVLAGDTTT